MTHSEAYREAMGHIKANGNDFLEKRITESEARDNLQAILEVYDQQVGSISNARELAKHTHDFGM